MRAVCLFPAMIPASLLLSCMDSAIPTSPYPVPNNSNLTSPGMRAIPGGTFRMGSTVNPAEQPVHSVTVSPFLMDTTDVTQADFQSWCGYDSAHYQGNTLRPMESITWFDAVLYCNARSKRDSLDTVYSYSLAEGGQGRCTGLDYLVIDTSKHGYRLPTEAEWEYACRAGSATDFYWGGSFPPVTRADTLAMDSNAVWIHNSGSLTLPVASRKPNSWGLYDMAGNVWEWCDDWYAGYGATAQVNPAGPSSGIACVLRGGSCVQSDTLLRSANRTSIPPSGGSWVVGFRCVRKQG